MKNALAVIGAVALAACSAGTRPPRVSPEAAALEHLRDADALVLAGCFDCLVEAQARYQEAGKVPSAAAPAAAGAARAAGLLALRERELGFVDSGYLARAGSLAAAHPTLGQSLAPMLEIAASIPPQRGGSRGLQASSDAELTAMQAAYRNRVGWTAQLEARAADDPLAAYLWLAFNCVFGTATPDALAEWATRIASWRETPLIKFKLATCGSFDGDALDGLLAADPRFVEVHYYAGLRAILGGNLDEAADRFQRAYTWHAQWPAAANSLANVYLTAEDFERSAEFYQRTLDMAPNQPDALLGRIRALTYLGRSADAIAAADALLALERWHVGDARYWRALNEVQLDQLDAAWADVELAARLRVDAEVPKLAGIISYRRRELEIARAKFDESLGRNPDDCETGFYRGVVLGDLRAWGPASRALAEAAACLEASNEALGAQIAQLRVSAEPPGRRARQIARREKQIGQQDRMLRTSWFNLAVAHYSLQQHDEARQFAEKVAADEQFGARAREILGRLKPPPDN